MIPTPQSVTIHRYTLGTADAHGNAAESWVADAAPTLVHAVAPGASAEALQTGRDVSQVAWTVYAPQGVSVAARDRIVWRGATYLVHGEAADYGHGPWSHPSAGVVIELKRWES